jgi:hypothetical protein
MNNYGVYFQEDGELILNLVRGLLMSVIQNESSEKTVKEAMSCIRMAKELTEHFHAISAKTYSYNRMRVGGKLVNNDDN